MITKLFIFSMLTSFIFSASESTKTSKVGSEWDTQTLDVVTTIKPLQALIIGYMGAFEYVEDRSKLVTAENYRSQAFGLIQIFGHTSKLFGFSKLDNFSTDVGVLGESQHDKRFARKFDFEVRIYSPWSPQNNNMQSDRLFPQNPEEIYAVGFSSEKDKIMIVKRASTTGTMRLEFWSLSGPVVVHTIETNIPLPEFVSGDDSLFYYPHQAVAYAKYSPDGNYIIYEDFANKQIVILDAKNYQIAGYIPDIDMSVCEFSRDSNYIAYTQENSKTIRFLEKKHNPLLK